MRIDILGDSAAWGGGTASQLPFDISPERRRSGENRFGVEDELFREATREAEVKVDGDAAPLEELERRALGGSEIRAGISLAMSDLRRNIPSAPRACGSARCGGISRSSTLSIPILRFPAQHHINQ